MKIFLIAGVLVLIAGALILPSLRSDPGTGTAGMPTGVPAATESITRPSASRYTDYSGPAFAQNDDRKRVLFFYAPWCPTCRPADAAFRAQSDRIPEDVVLLRTDYDSSADLKKRYGVTYQHTYVLVDGSGNEIRKWNGGGLDELIANTR